MKYLQYFLVGGLAYLLARCLQIVVAMLLFPEFTLRVFEGAGSQASAKALMLSCVCVPFLEELIFRKIIFVNMERFAGTGVASVVAVTIFAGLHYQYWGGPFWVNPMVLGCFCQLIFVLERSIWSSVLVHVGFNTSVSLPKPGLQTLLTHSEVFLVVGTLLTSLVVGFGILGILFDIKRRHQIAE